MAVTTYSLQIGARNWSTESSAYMTSFYDLLWNRQVLRIHQDQIMMESIINQRLNFDEMSCDEEEDNSSEATNSSNSGKSAEI